jgi:hypothetical protein
VYTVVANLVNWPAGIITCGRAKSEVDKEFVKSDAEYEPACKSRLRLGYDKPDLLTE